ncbi:DUF1592 domain-containing protein [Pseudenhygromyxa sp. WMMC2535]|uniref:DUF1592 domain-containing protein n=1 Tax=Pseudenhygromyxa sp. WMMC2535 TaxID=2712867 RepID=UPI00155608DA|nr:DUF1592 domain-containing protein [Pseudenhygromyxa sp. WMMC2535]NVB38544.1 DUF1592 domain-containing protein [Pseudenhygromyxa sp. WMMC2535]
MASLSLGLLSLPAFVLAPACYIGVDNEDTFADSVGDDAGSGGEGQEGADGGEDEGAEELVDVDYAEPRLRILLGRQYVNSITDLLGPVAGLAASPRDDIALNGFDAVGASQLSMSDADVDTYESSAVAVAAAAMTDEGALDPYLVCTPSEPGDAECMASFVENFGFMAWRRQLDADELARWTAVGLDAALDYGDFESGLEFVIAGMLQSPYFLYQVEIGAPAPALGEGLRKLSGTELATRLSYFLLDTTPSRALLEAGEAGELDTAEGVRAWAEQLLADPRSRAAFQSYWEELLELRELGETAKDLELFPEWTPYLAESMKLETTTLIDEVMWIEDGDFRDILDADHTYVNQALADLYGVEFPGGSGFAKVELPASEGRGGIFGHAGLLSALAHVNSTSPTIRGKFVQERVLCTSIPPPPPNVVTDLPITDDAKTMRQRLEMHQEEPTCAACHLLMDPIGLGLENYDGIGRFRTTENGEPIDALSDLDGVAFEGAQQLGQAVRDKSRFSLCTVLNLYRHATGHVESGGEVDRLYEVDAAFIQSDYRLQGAIVELVASRAFRYVGEQQQ